MEILLLTYPSQRNSLMNVPKRKTGVKLSVNEEPREPMFTAKEEV